METHAVDNRCHGICDVFGSAGVAHGSAVESLQEKLWMESSGLDGVAALALLFLTGTQTAFGQHNLETDTDQRVGGRGGGRGVSPLRFSPPILQYEV